MAENDTLFSTMASSASNARRVRSQPASAAGRFGQARAGSSAAMAGRSVPRWRARTACACRPAPCSTDTPCCTAWRRCRPRASRRPTTRPSCGPR
ncbi:hypothetical protein RZS08_58830, partial [Arthrospira platensis SPKY1]|nr:hypothetical protein [Arthrospira platensis SPKY1]